MRIDQGPAGPLFKASPARLACMHTDWSASAPKHPAGAMLAQRRLPMPDSGACLLVHVCATAGGGPADWGGVQRGVAHQALDRREASLAALPAAPAAPAAVLMHRGVCALKLLARCTASRSQCSMRAPPRNCCRTCPPAMQVCIAHRTGQRISGPQFFGFSDPLTQRAIALNLYSQDELAAALRVGRAAAVHGARFWAPAAGACAGRHA